MAWNFDYCASLIRHPDLYGQCLISEVLQYIIILHLSNTPCNTLDWPVSLPRVRPDRRAGSHLLYMYEELPHHSVLICELRNSDANKLSMFKEIFSKLCSRDTSSYGESHLTLKINKFWNIENICNECLFILFAQVRDQVLRSSHFKISEY